MAYSFVELLIFFWLSQVDIYCLEFISHHITEILYLNTNSKGKQSWNKKSIFSCFFHEIKTNIFTCFFEQSFFSQFHEHVFRSSRSQMFFKIGALKDFAILWINNSFFIEYLRWLLLYFFKSNQTVILHM